MKKLVYTEKAIDYQSKRIKLMLKKEITVQKLLMMLLRWNKMFVVLSLKVRSYDFLSHKFLIFSNLKLILSKGIKDRSKNNIFVIHYNEVPSDN